MSVSSSLASTDDEDDEKRDPNYVDWRNMEVTWSVHFMLSLHHLSKKHCSTTLHLPLSQNIRVICRFRPINSREMREEKSNNLEDKPPLIEQGGRVVKVHRDGTYINTAPKEYYLDRILPTTTSQQQLYLNVGKPMVEACLEGYNTTIFAYGQTGHLSRPSFSSFNLILEMDKMTLY